MDPRTTRCVPGRSHLRGLRSATTMRSAARMRCIHRGTDEHDRSDGNARNGDLRATAREDDESDRDGTAG